jgi:hypothetical protein
MSCALIFARDLEEGEMFEAFGLDPTSARTEDRIFDPDRGRVRVGRLAPWTFAIDDHMVNLDLAVHGKNVGKRLSAGTEVAVIESTEKPTENFEYWADGVKVTSFEPYRAFDRYGSDPDRFLDEMRQVGMRTEADYEAEGPGNDLLAVLDMATLALGIRLPEEVATGPLATVTLPGDR